MAAYFHPNMPGNDILEVPSSGGISDDESWSNGYSADYFDASIEQLRGSPSSRPPHTRRPVDDLEEEDDEIPSRFELLRRQQVPIEERRKIPGCGINEFDLFDNPIHAETGSIAPDFFQPALKAYESPSPLSSASSSPPPAYEDFQPGLQSSFMRTPPHQQFQIRGNQVEGHPAYVPSYNVYPPENYYPSPSSSSPPSDQSVFERTPEPEQNRGVSQRVQQVERVFEDMFPTYSQEDGAPHDYEDDGDEYDNKFASYYSGSNFCSLL